MSSEESNTERKIVRLEEALELACRDAVEECGRARTAEARVQRLEGALRVAIETFEVLLEQLGIEYLDPLMFTIVHLESALSSEAATSEAPEKEE